jgi:hypothetical protein
MPIVIKSDSLHRTIKQNELQSTGLHQVPLPIAHYARRQPFLFEKNQPEAVVGDRLDSDETQLSQEERAQQKK